MPTTGLPTGERFRGRCRITRRSRSTRSASRASASSAGGPFGTGVAGGVSMIFGDQLSDRQIFAAIQANGTVKDIGGALQYYNLKNRWNWGAGVAAHPVSHGRRLSADTTSLGPATYSVNQLLQRIYIDQAHGVHAVSVLDDASGSSSRRTSRTTGSTRSCSRRSYDAAIERRRSGESMTDRAVGYKPVWFAEPSVALVGDNSFSAFTSPVQGERYRAAVHADVGLGDVSDRRCSTIASTCSCGRSRSPSAACRSAATAAAPRT